MGIDVYLTWKGQKEAEQKAQMTGFRTDKGHVGYLREGYHGGPYACMALVPEGWNDATELDENGTFAIEAKTLRERLPGTVMVAIYREDVVYGNGQDPALGNGDEDMYSSLRRIFASMKDRSAIDLAANTTDEQKRQTNKLIAKRDLPDYVLSYVDFVDLAERKEKETGEPCRILVSA